MMPSRSCCYTCRETHWNWTNHSLCCFN